MIASVLKSWDKYSHDLRREKKKKKTFNWNTQAKVVSWPKLQFFLFLGLQSIFTFGILKRVFTTTLSGDAILLSWERWGRAEVNGLPKDKRLSVWGPEFWLWVSLSLPDNACWSWLLSACPRPFPMSPCVLSNQFTGSIWNLHPPQTFHLSKLSKDYFWWNLCLGSYQKYFMEFYY